VANVYADNVSHNLKALNGHI